MTRQEEVEAGIFRHVTWGITNNKIAETAHKILHYLHSEGMVIKVEKELPKNPINITTDLGLTEEEANIRQLQNNCFVEVIQDQMLQAGWVAVEPLIKEE